MLVEQFSFNEIGKETFDLYFSEDKNIEYEDFFTTKLNRIYTAYLEKYNPIQFRNEVIDKGMFFTGSYIEDIITEYDGFINSKSQLLSLINDFATEGYPRTFIEELCKHCLSNESKYKKMQELRTRLGYFFDLRIMLSYDDILDLCEVYEELSTYKLSYYFYNKYKSKSSINLTKETRETSEFIKSIIGNVSKNNREYHMIIKSLFKMGKRFPYKEYFDETKKINVTAYYKTIERLNLSDILREYELNVNKSTIEQMDRVAEGRLVTKIKSSRNPLVKSDHKIQNLINQAFINLSKMKDDNNIVSSNDEIFGEVSLIQSWPRENESWKEVSLNRFEFQGY